jgi:uncharacterized protein YvpB
MIAPGQRRAPARSTIWRRRLLALIAILAVIAAVVIGVRVTTGGGIVNSATPPPATPEWVRLKLGDKTVARLRVDQAGDRAAFRAALARLPDRRVARVGKARITFAVDRAATGAALRRALRDGGATVAVVERPTSSSIAVPLIAQVLQDDCEATALAMVLAQSGRAVGQLALQRQVAHAPPLDPTIGPNGEEVWGDPARGFVGRADGGGPGGGFGVYQGPIRALAKRHGLEMTELSGARPARLYAALLAGHPVLAWVALSAGPYAQWTSPAGKAIEVNYGEHAVVLTGVDGAGVHVNDPLSGERLIWSKPQFEQMWAGLGHRALAA